MKKTIEKYYCDVCGKEFNKWELDNKIILKRKYTMNVDSNGEAHPMDSYEFNSLEVCPHCITKMIDFFKTYVKETGDIGEVKEDDEWM